MNYENSHAGEPGSPGGEIRLDGRLVHSATLFDRRDAP